MNPDAVVAGCQQSVDFLTGFSNFLLEICFPHTWDRVVDELGKHPCSRFVGSCLSGNVRIVAPGCISKLMNQGVEVNLQGSNFSVIARDGVTGPPRSDERKVIVDICGAFSVQMHELVELGQVASVPLNSMNHRSPSQKSER